jgi:hypothetical protein
MVDVRDPPGKNANNVVARAAAKACAAAFDIACIPAEHVQQIMNSIVPATLKCQRHQEPE